MNVVSTNGVSLRLLVINTRNIYVSKAFYQALGLRFVEERHGNGPVRYSALLGSTTIELHSWSDHDPPPDSSVRLGSEVDAFHVVLDYLLQETAAAVLECPEMTPRGEYRAVVSDPDGRAVELYGKGKDQA